MKYNFRCTQACISSSIVLKNCEMSFFACEGDAGEAIQTVAQKDKQLVKVLFEFSGNDSRRQASSKSHRN